MRKTVQCKFYNRGICKYGDNCNFLHGKSDPFLQAEKDKLKHILCRNYENQGSCKYGDKCIYKHQEKSYIKCLICEIDTKHLSKHCSPIMEKNFCDNCINNDISVQKQETILPDELLNMISYYVKDKQELVNMYKSECFHMINTNEYWIYRFIKLNPRLRYYQVSEFMSDINKLSDRIIFKMKVEDNRLNLLDEYGKLFRSGKIKNKGKKKVKVEYLVNEKTYEGYSSDLGLRDEYDTIIEVKYNLPLDIKEVPNHFIEQQYSNTSRNEYESKILNVKYIEDDYEGDSESKLDENNYKITSNKLRLRQTGRSIDVGNIGLGLVTCKKCLQTFIQRGFGSDESCYHCSW